MTPATATVATVKGVQAAVDIFWADRQSDLYPRRTARLPVYGIIVLGCAWLIAFPDASLFDQIWLCV